MLLNAGADASKEDRWGGLAIHDSKRQKFDAISQILMQAAVGAVGSFAVDMSVSKSQPNQVVASNSITTASTIEVLAAASEGSVKELRRLKKKGSSLLQSDYDGRTALHQASANGHLEAVTFLAAEKKVNINVQDNDHHTPLSDAIHGGHTAVVDFLKSVGAAMNTSEGELCNLAANGDMHGLEQKIAIGGVDANTADYDGRTAMHLAAAAGNLKMISMLVEHKANVDVQDRFGGTPLDDASRANKSDAASLLRQFGAKIQAEPLAASADSTQSVLKMTPV